MATEVDEHITEEEPGVWEELVERMNKFGPTQTEEFGIILRPCQWGPACINRHTSCKYLHTNLAYQILPGGRINCRHGENCNKKDTCMFAHESTTKVPICNNGSKCWSKNCKFKHVEDEKGYRCSMKDREEGKHCARKCFLEHN
jgi:hypothetical protein